MPLPTLPTTLFASHAKLLRRSAGTTLLLLSIAALAHVESTPTLGELARRAPVILANTPAPVDEARFAAATGLLTSKMLIGDDAYLRPGPFVAVRRRTEMFSWTQGRDGDTATYATGWSETPENSEDFDVPEGHQNPPKALTSRSFLASDARVGVYDVDLGSIALPYFQSLELAPSTVQGDDVDVTPDALFVGKGTLESPQVGDMRIRYEVIPQTVAVTAFGWVNAKKIEPFMAPHGLRLYHLFYGYRDAALLKLAPFSGPSPTLFRVLALVAVWLSLILLTRQLRVDHRLEQLHFLVRLALLFAAAIVLTGVCIVLSMSGGVLWPAVLLSTLVVFALLFLDVHRHSAQMASPAPAPVAAPPTPAATAPLPSPAPLSIKPLERTAAKATPAPLSPPSVAPTVKKTPVKKSPKKPAPKRTAAKASPRSSAPSPRKSSASVRRSKR